jgi:hypothetical protein
VHGSGKDTHTLAAQLSPFAFGGKIEEPPTKFA